MAANLLKFAGKSQLSVHHWSLSSPRITQDAEEKPRSFFEMDAAADIEQHNPTNALQTAKDLFSGAAGGIAQVLSGMLEIFFSFAILPTVR